MHRLLETWAACGSSAACLGVLTSSAITKESKVHTKLLCGRQSPLMEDKGAGVGSNRPCGMACTCSLHKLTCLGSAHPEIDLLGDEVAHQGRPQGNVCLQLCEGSRQQVGMAGAIASHLNTGDTRLLGACGQAASVAGSLPPRITTRQAGRHIWSCSVTCWLGQHQAAAAHTAAWEGASLSESWSTGDHRQLAAQ